ncbi:DUF1569 domain-containing protein [Thalassolituus sp. LLYu03]|uniref:DUF1569 domain-containing protein n=1 Tax=Thalassolituus sp. LLYu03 TaxID=3421656 RepID=UPI003D2CE272
MAVFSRRGFIRASLLGSGAVVLGGIAVKTVADQSDVSLSALKDELNAMPWASLTNAGSWNISQVLQHLAQSIDYSMDGYPQMKPEWFRLTAGSAAFNVFGAMGKMRHPLDQEIPGATPLVVQMPVADALAQLNMAIDRFLQNTAPLAPHFAYGDLSQRQYETAHWLHIRNHLGIIA